jgi:putative ABC transport system substrate-binding protein
VLGGAAAWPLAARAQQVQRLRRLGILIGHADNDPETRARIEAFRRGMQGLGWSEDRNLQIDYRWAEPDAERIKTFASELVGTSPDVILAETSPCVSALSRATRTIPIVFAGIGDPVGQGFVASLARPGRNITGFTGFEFSIGEKWVGLLKEVAPGITRAAYLFHPELGPYYAQWLKSVESAAATFGVQTAATPVRAVADLEHAIKGVGAQPNGGLIVQPDGYTSANRLLIIELAARHRLPAVYGLRYEVTDGGLVSYGPDVRDLYRRSAAYVDRLLKGEKAADLPVQTPTKYELAINLKTAKALGLDVPPTLLARADEVIE